MIQKKELLAAQFPYQQHKGSLARPIKIQIVTEKSKPESFPSEVGSLRVF